MLTTMSGRAVGHFVCSFLPCVVVRWACWPSVVLPALPHPRAVARTRYLPTQIISKSTSTPVRHVNQPCQGVAPSNKTVTIRSPLATFSVGLGGCQLGSNSPDRSVGSGSCHYLVPVSSLANGSSRLPWFARIILVCFLPFGLGPGRRCCFSRALFSSFFLVFCVFLRFRPHQVGRQASFIASPCQCLRLSATCQWQQTEYRRRERASSCSSGHPMRGLLSCILFSVLSVLYFSVTDLLSPSHGPLHLFQQPHCNVQGQRKVE